MEELQSKGKWQKKKELKMQKRDHLFVAIVPWFHRPREVICN
jgi:hypothetical protein